MSLHSFNFWLLDSAVGVTGALFVGCVAMRVLRQPAARKWVATWTLMGCIVAAVLAALPAIPRMAVPVAACGRRARA